MSAMNVQLPIMYVPWLIYEQMLAKPLQSVFITFYSLFLYSLKCLHTVLALQVVGLPFDVHLLIIS